MNSSHQTLLSQARQNASLGNPEKAMQLLKKLLETSRNDSELQAICYFEIGKIYTIIHKDETAIKFLKKAISVNPEVLIQELDWLQGLKHKNKKHIIDELERAQSEYKEYLFLRTKDAANQKSFSFADGTPGETSYPAGIQPNSVLAGEDNLTQCKFAGFWKRVIASIVDNLIFLFVNLIMLVILVYGFGFTFAAFAVPTTEEEAYIAGFMGGFMGYFVWYFVSILVWWLYYAIMESSRCQGTLGKMLLGIYITDEEGKRIGVGRASGRYFLKTLLYAVPLLNIVDCVMVAVTEKKQAWHDMPVGCLVLSK